MKSLLLVAHGSRRPQSNDEIRELTHRLRKKDEARYDFIECAFLELAEPSIPDGIEQCIQQGATTVTVFPYFLSAGRHVATDIPEEVAGKQAEYPNLDIHIAPYLGAIEDMPNLILRNSKAKSL